MSVSEMPQRERPLSEQFRIVAKQYAAANKEASFHERTRTAFRSRLVQKRIESSNEKLSYAKAETLVEASEEWMKFNLTMVEAREKADILKAQMEYIRIVQWEQNDINANARAERKMA